MKNITFHFHSNNSPIAKIIEWRTGSGYSHVSVEVNGNFYNAYADKRIYKTNKRSDDIKESYNIPVTNEIADYAENVMEQFIGSLYDYKAMFGFLVNSDKNSKGRIFCSEMANIVLELITGVKADHEKLVSPESIRIAVMYFIIGLYKNKPKTSTGNT
jgi:hypothetical protein